MAMPDLMNFSEELESELRSLAAWWLAHAVDTDRGKVAGEVSNRNRKKRFRGKSLVLITRITWFFSAVYRHDAREEYREAAALAYRLLMDRFLDPVHHGMHWTLDWKNRPVSRKKQTYGQAFAIYALSEYHRAFGDESAIIAAGKLVELLEKNVYDRESGAYLEARGEDWSAIEGECVDDVDADITMNTHLHILEAYTNYYRARPSPEFATVLSNLTSLFIDRFAQVRGDNLVQHYSRNWAEIPAAITFGHDIEASWLITKTATALADKDLEKRAQTAAIKLAHGVLARGPDEYGGISMELSPAGHRNPVREWWAQAEAMVGFMNAWQMSGEQPFLDASKRCWQFIRSHHIDNNFGEWRWYSSLDKQHGTMYKAGPWKGPYHNGRALLEMIKRMGQEDRQ